jgi:PBP1b-binding outer membrane lipoprotein LpoB
MRIKIKINKSLPHITTIFFLFFCLYSCSSMSSYVEVTASIAKKPELDLAPYEEIIITDFVQKNENPDFDINNEIKEYFAQELTVETKKRVTVEQVSAEDEKNFNEREFWVGLFNNVKKGIILSGTYEYKSETRKALIKDKKKFEDPFSYEDRFTQRNMYSLKLDLYFIDSQTGEILFQKKFSETKAYENPNQTSAFAFYDLIFSIKEKVFRDLFAEPRPQQRYLILK